MQILTELQKRGIGFESMSEKIETDSAAGKQVFHMFSTLSEFELNLIRERTWAGLVASRVHVLVGGHKPKLDEKQVREIKALSHESEIQVVEVARRCGASTPSYTDTLVSPR